MNFARKYGIGMLDAVVRLIFVFIVVLVIVKLSQTAYYYGYNIFNQTPVASGEGRTVSVTIEDGDTVDDIAKKLSEAGLISDKRLFKWQEKTSEYRGKEKGGTYELSTSMTPEEMIRTMARFDENGEPIEEPADEDINDVISNIEEGEGGDEDAGNEEAEAEEAAEAAEEDAGE